MPYVIYFRISHWPLTPAYQLQGQPGLPGLPGEKGVPGIAGPRVSREIILDYPR